MVYYLLRSLLFVRLLCESQSGALIELNHCLAFVTRLEHYLITNIAGCLAFSFVLFGSGLILHLGLFHSWCDLGRRLTLMLLLNFGDLTAIIDNLLWNWDFRWSRVALFFLQRGREWFVQAFDGLRLLRLLVLFDRVESHYVWHANWLCRELGPSWEIPYLWLHRLHFDQTSKIIRALRSCATSFDFNLTALNFLNWLKLLI